MKQPTIKPSPERRKIAAYLESYAREISAVALPRGQARDRYWLGSRDALKNAAREIRASYDIAVRMRQKGER